MCLDKITTRHGRLRRHFSKPQLAWKIVADVTDVEITTIHLSRVLARGQWHTAENKTGHDEYFDDYRLGFHAWKNRPTRTLYNHEMVMPVMLHRIRTRGEQNDKKVWVADEMYIPTVEEQKQWDPVYKINAQWDSLMDVNSLLDVIGGLR